MDGLQVCPVLAIKLMSIGLLLGNTSTPIRYGHINMPPCLKCPIGLLVYTSRSAHEPAPDGFVLSWNRAGIDPKYKGGSVSMAAASATSDCGVPIDVVLDTGRWAGWQIFNKFYN